MSEEINKQRRNLFGVAAASVAAAQLAMISSVNAQTDQGAAAVAVPLRAANVVWGPIRQVSAGLLNIGYAELGPVTGPAVVLLHGWPYDIHSFV